MTERSAPPAGEPEDVLWCADLDRAIAVFSQLGLRLDTIFPADDPAVASLSGHGLRLRVVRAGASDLAPLDLPPFSPCQSASVTTPAPPAFSVVRAAQAAWKTGRAGMLYRDLIPDRQGGRYIASHIRIPEGGPVPDYVHYHAIQFQLIYCYQGWVRVVYEDQGEPFVMHAGECVLQPPGIRHRVLEASRGLEVIELGVPAVHATHVDHELALPTETLRSDRAFSGQRFVRHLPTSARYVAGRLPGFDACELGISAATGGLAAVQVLRARAPGRISYRHDAELMFHVVLRGAVTLDDTHRLGAADAFVVPAGRPVTWSDASAELELLEVALPGDHALELLASAS